MLNTNSTAGLLWLNEYNRYARDSSVVLLPSRLVAPRYHLHLLVDIGLAKVELRRALDGLDYRNLDAEPAFAGLNTTTEFLCHHIHGLLVAALKAGRLGPQAENVTGLKVLLRESPNAWAAYEGPIGEGPTA